MRTNGNLRKLYRIIQKNMIFTEKEICESCPILCSRKQKWHWLLPEEIEELKNEMKIENKFGAFFFESGKCHLLKNTHCSIYEKRPLECRLSPLSFYFMNNRLFWVIDIKCPYFKKYKNDKKFWSKVNNFIIKIEPYLTEDIIKNLIKTSEAVNNFDPLIENKDFISIKDLSLSHEANR